VAVVGELDAVLRAPTAQFKADLAQGETAVRSFSQSLSATATPALERFGKGIGVMERREASRAMMELRSGLTMLSAGAVGAHGPVERLGLAMLNFGVGGIWGLAILGGIAAVAAALKLLNQSAEEQDKAFSDMVPKSQAFLKGAYGSMAEHRVGLVDARSVIKQLNDEATKLETQAKNLQALSTRAGPLGAVIEFLFKNNPDQATAKAIAFRQQVAELTNALNAMEAHAEKPAEQAIDRLTRLLEEQRIKLKAVQEGWSPAQLAGALMHASEEYKKLDSVTRAKLDALASEEGHVKDLTKAYQDLVAKGLIPYVSQGKLYGVNPAATNVTAGGQAAANAPAPTTPQAGFAGKTPAEITGLGLRTDIGLALQGRAALGITTEYYHQLEQRTQEHKEKMVDLTKAMATGVADATKGLLEGMALLIVDSGGKFRALQQLVEGVIGAMLVNIGKAMIAQGTAGVAIKHFIVNPAAAIVAGVALVALGSALAAAATASVSAAGSSLAGGGGGAAGYSGPAGASLGTTSTGSGQGTLTIVFPAKKTFDPSDPASQQAFAEFMSNVAQRNVVVRYDG
jgi:hypothetical protein